MKICVVHPRVTKESAFRLASALKARQLSGHDYIPPGYDLYFNYGCGWDFGVPKSKTINHFSAIHVSVDKIRSYKAFQKAGVATCEFVTKEKDIPSSWRWVVCRETTTGRDCEGVTITRNGDTVPDCPLYTKFFRHTEEHRIVVFKGQIVARYMKTNLKEGNYELQFMYPQGYEELDQSSIKAASAVGLDFAGVDVLYDSRTGKHLVLEINSGPLLTEEMEAFFVNYFKGK